MRRADTTNLLRDPQTNLFKWSKSGIILNKGYVKINLNELEPDAALDILYQLSDEELNRSQILDTKEVIEYYKNKLENESNI